MHAISSKFFKKFFFSWDNQGRRWLGGLCHILTVLRFDGLKYH